jgi:hypothetical protein
VELLDLAMGYLARCSWGELAGLLAAALGLLYSGGKAAWAAAKGAAALAASAAAAARDWWQKPARLDRIEGKVDRLIGGQTCLALGWFRFTGGGASLSHDPAGGPVVNATFSCATHESARRLKDVLDKFLQDHKAG